MALCTVTAGEARAHKDAVRKGLCAGLGDEDGMRGVLDRALWICVVVGVPVAVMMVTLGDWAMRILFVRGAFDRAAAEAAAAILAAYALGLVPALAIRSLVAGFHGRGDTRTPLRLLVVATLVNIAVKLTLAPAWGAVGLALGTSVGIALYAGLLWRAARGRGFASGPRLAEAGVMAGIGLAAGLLVLWARPSLLAALETLMGAWALPIASLLLATVIVAIHGVGHALLQARRTRLQRGPEDS